MLLKRFILALCAIGAIVIGIVALYTNSYHSHAERLSIAKLESMPTLKIGDIVLREGIGTDSAVIKMLSNSPYSHIGLVIATNPTIILHATTDDDKNKPNQVLLSSFEAFLRQARGVAIKRFDIDDKAREQIALESSAWLQKPFELKPLNAIEVAESSIYDEKPIYCTTLIEAILAPYATLNVEYQYVNMPILKGYYLFPKAFLESSASSLIYEKRIK